MSNEANTAATEAKTPLTLEEKLVIAEARVAKLKQLILTADLLNNVESGDEVSFKFGRGETVKELSGVVASSFETPQGRSAIVIAGNKPYTIHVRAITANAAADARRGGEGTVAEAAAEVEADAAEEAATDAADAGANVDPLNIA